MRTRIFLLTVAMSVGLSPAAWGQTPLSNAEVQQILQQVTSHPRRTWIPAGTIKAKHQEHGAAKVTNTGTIQSEIARALQDYQNNPNKPEQTAQLQQMTLDAIPFNVRYQLANVHDMLSDVEVRYDGNRFYWEINVTGRSDSIPLDPSLQGNFKVEHYRQHEFLNRHRIFVWDGQTYTVYSASGNRATIDTAGRLPRAVHGPLTAGLIPWGYGPYTAANLAATPVAAVRTAAGAIEMTLTFGPGSSATLTLDPAAGYAVTKAVLTHAAGPVTTYTCAGYQSYGGNWVPSSVSIRAVDLHVGQHRRAGRLPRAPAGQHGGRVLVASERLTVALYPIQHGGYGEPPGPAPGLRSGGSRRRELRHGGFAAGRGGVRKILPGRRPGPPGRAGRPHQPV
jgi:hypothetical protein